MSYVFWYYKHTHKIILVFANFFRIFLKFFCHFLSFFFAIGVKKPPLGFDNGFDDRLLHSFYW